MYWRAAFTNRFKKCYRRLAPQVQQLVKNVIAEILQNPYKGKRLVGNLAGFWSWRVGKLRILYQIDEQNKVVIFHVVEYREEVY